MTKEYKGWSLFNDVEDVRLRTWNRCAVTFNMNAIDLAARDGYIDHIDKEGQAQMKAMLEYIKVKGYDVTRKSIFGELKAVGGVH